MRVLSNISIEDMGIKTLREIQMKHRGIGLLLTMVLACGLLLITQPGETASSSHSGHSGGHSSGHSSGGYGGSSHFSHGYSGGGSHGMSGYFGGHHGSGGYGGSYNSGNH